MSAPREACNIQLVKIQPDERLATTSELNSAPDRVICHREARGMGYGATTQVKGLSPEITIVSEADTVHKGAGNSLDTDRRRGIKNPTGSKTVATYQKDIAGTWENQYIPERVCNHKPINGEGLQMIYWWSDKSIVAMKFRNGNGAKGLTRIPMEGDTSATLRGGSQMATKPKPMTYSLEDREVFLKSRVRENLKHGSVRGLIVASQLNWRWL